MTRSGICLLTVSLFTIFIVGACSSSSKRAVAESLPAYQPTPQSTPVQMAVKPAPKVAEVQEAVKRVFKDAAVIDTRYNPNFLTGDFNGDASQDLAVILKPAKLDQLNEEYPPWLLRDPLSNQPSRIPLKIDK